MLIEECLRPDVEKRQELAKSIGIEDRCRTVAEVLGERYYWYGQGILADGLWGDYLPSESGYRYRDRNIEVKAYTKDDKRDLVKVTQRWLWLPSLDPVFCQEDGIVHIFREEDQWYGRLEALYQKALRTIKQNKNEEQKMEEMRARCIKESYGLD